MEIRITDMSVQDAAGVLSALASLMQNSAAHGDMPTEYYANVFELMGSIADAIRQEAGCAA